MEQAREQGVKPSLHDMQKPVLYNVMYTMLLCDWSTELWSTNHVPWENVDIRNLFLQVRDSGLVEKYNLSIGYINLQQPNRLKNIN